MRPYEYSFDERLEMSQGVSTSKSVRDILVENIPGALGAYKSTQEEDRSGVDWWVKHKSGHHLSVDCKIRGRDFREDEERGFPDDLALETWSVVEKEIPGWTLRDDKKTDYILWLWKDTGRWCLVPFPMLCKVFQENMDRWVEYYGPPVQQFTPEGKYHSECIFVSRKEVWSEIYKKYSGQS